MLFACQACHIISPESIIISFWHYIVLIVVTYPSNSIHLQHLQQLSNQRHPRSEVGSLYRWYTRWSATTKRLKSTDVNFSGEAKRPFKSLVYNKLWLCYLSIVTSELFICRYTNVGIMLLKCYWFHFDKIRLSFCHYTAARSKIFFLSWRTNRIFWKYMCERDQMCLK